MTPMMYGKTIKTMLDRNSSTSPKMNRVRYGRMNWKILSASRKFSRDTIKDRELSDFAMAQSSAWKLNIV